MFLWFHPISLKTFLISRIYRYFLFAMVVPFNKNENKLCRISPGYRTNNVFVMFSSPSLPSLHSIPKEFKRKFVANIKPKSKNYLRFNLRLHQAMTWAIKFWNIIKPINLILYNKMIFVFSSIHWNEYFFLYKLNVFILQNNTYSSNPLLNENIYVFECLHYPDNWVQPTATI